MNIVEYLKVMVETDASDLYLTVGSPPVYRIQGVMRPICDHVFSAEELEDLAKGAMNEKQQAEATKWIWPWFCRCLISADFESTCFASAALRLLSFAPLNTTSRLSISLGCHRL